MNISISSIKLLAALILFFIAINFPASVQAQDPDLAGDQQNRALPGLDVIILVDESETMWNTTDPDSVRVNTVNFFIDILSSDQSEAQAHRAAIVAFGTTPRVIPFTLLDSPAAAEALKQQYDQLHKSIEPVKDVQYTDINEALKSALTLLDEESDPSRKPGIIMISDGQPTNPDVSEKKGQDVVEAYLAETRQLLEQLEQHKFENELCENSAGVPLFTIGMGIDNLRAISSQEFTTLYQEFWQSIASTSGGYYREAQRLQDMQNISTYIFSELLCTPATPSLKLRSSQTLEYQVFDNYYQIVFTISGKENPELRAKIYRPNADGTLADTLLQKDEEGVAWQGGPDYEIWRIVYTEPWEGTWRVTLEGDGQAEFNYVTFPNVTIDVEEPRGGFLSADSPFTLQATIVDEKGQQVELPVNDFQVEIEGPDTRRQVRLEPNGNSYTAKLDALEETGEYSLTFSTILPDGTPLFEHKFISLITAPWTEIMTPEEGQSYLPDDTISVEADVHLTGAALLDGVTAIALLQSDGQTVQTIELSQGQTLSEDDQEMVVAYSGQFQAPEDDGNYTIQTKLMAILPGGRVFDSETPLTQFAVVAPPTATPSPTSTPTETPTLEPTPTPTATQAAVALITPSPTASPTPLPTATPVPTWAETIASPSYWPCWVLLLLLLLAAIVAFFWRKKRQPTPDNIKLLAKLIRSRRASDEAPYLLVLGSGVSTHLGSSSMKQIVRSISNSEDLEKYYQMLDGFSPKERYLLLKEHFTGAKLSSGYRALAELVEQGYFNLIFTTNADPFIERSLTREQDRTLMSEVLICGQQHIQDSLERLASPVPPVKIVKLHGDVDAGNFAFTPSEISNIGQESERILHQYLRNDLILIGLGPRDYDLNRAIEHQGGSIWYVNYEAPAEDTPLHRAMHARHTEANTIDGDFGLFDRFFEALHKELMRQTQKG